MSNIQPKQYGTKVDLPFFVSSDDLPEEFNRYLIGFENALAADPSISAKSKPHSLRRVLVDWIDPASEWIRANSPQSLPEILSWSDSPQSPIALPLSELIMTSPGRADDLIRIWDASVSGELADCANALRSALSLAQIYVPGAKEVFVYSPFHVDKDEVKAGETSTNPSRGARSVKNNRKGPRFSYLRHHDKQYCLFCGRLTEIEARRMELIRSPEFSPHLKELLKANMPLIEEGLSLTFCFHHKKKDGDRAAYDKGRRNHRFVAALSYLARLQKGMVLVPIDAEPRTLMVEILDQLRNEDRLHKKQHALIRNLPQFCQTFDYLNYRGSKRKVLQAVNKEFRRILEAVISIEKPVKPHVIQMRSLNAALGVEERGANIRKAVNRKG